MGFGFLVPLFFDEAEKWAGDGLGDYVDYFGRGSDSSGRPRRSCSRGTAVRCVQDDARLGSFHLEAVDRPRCSRPDRSEGGDLLAAL